MVFGFGKKKSRKGNEKQGKVVLFYVGNQKKRTIRVQYSNTLFNTWLRRDTRVSNIKILEDEDHFIEGEQRDFRVIKKRTAADENYFLENANGKRIQVTGYTKKERLNRCSQKLHELTERYSRYIEEGKAIADLGSKLTKLENIANKLQLDCRKSKQELPTAQTYISEARKYLKTIRQEVLTI
tara:strand:+ start:2516 stop:3064 length:549 start_codon:yes stop_codon:yes gene_type:complete